MCSTISWKFREPTHIVSDTGNEVQEYISIWVKCLKGIGETLIF